MSTLNAFGFTPRKARRSQSTQLPSTKVIDVNQSVAFIQPFDNKPVSPCNNHTIQTTTTRKRLNKKTNKKTDTHSNKITHYFGNNTTRPLDTLMDLEEQEAIVCVIRKKLPFLDLWNELEEEYSTDALMDVIEEEDIYAYSKCSRKHSEVDSDDVSMVIKRQKKTIDKDLSDVMNKFLNIKSRIIYNTPSPSQSFLNEYNKEEEEEDLKRNLRCKMTIEESNLFVLQITQEYLS